MSDYEEMVLFAVVVAIAILAIAVVSGINVYQDGEAAKVQACTSTGGSWVSGPSGFECRQEVPQ